MKIPMRNSTCAFLALLVCLPLTALAADSGVDFSCMSYQVWSKSHVSNQYRSYDIVIQNDCPGAVY